MKEYSLKWDFHFLRRAQLNSQLSKDPSTQTGAVIVRPNRTTCSDGFNGFPRTMPDEAKHYANREEKYSRIVHCEMNALIHAREPMEGYTLYTFPFLSCDRCIVSMLQAGITRFVAPLCPPDKAARWEGLFERSRLYAKECGAEVVEYPNTVFRYDEVDQ